MERAIPTPPAAPATTLAQTLRSSRRELSQAFARALETMPKWQARRAAQSDHDTYLQTEFHAFVDYLAAYFDTADAAYLQLFLGEQVKGLYDRSLDPAARVACAKAVGEQMLREVESTMRARLPADDWQRLSTALTQVWQQLTAQTSRTQRVLLVGDCMFLDIVPFVLGPLLDAGIVLIPEYATAKSHVELRRQLREFSAEKFDLVFYSPLSYDFSPDFDRLVHWRNAMLPAPQRDAGVDQVWADVQGTLELAADLFDCPIHVHNSAAIVREEAPGKRWLKAVLSSRARTQARNRFNAHLDAYVARKNGEGLKHLFVLDELALVAEQGEHHAGAFFYKTPIQHPSVMGRVLAPRYVDILIVNALLMKRKLVVCDLDNTLWDGVIGESAVQHFHERQSVLKELKAKGIVLAINSKNDPVNVHWRGGTLSDDDFVYAAISWAPKVQGMAQIHSELNLKIKDSVFVDDRADERELMNSIYPELLCVDATDTATWRRFALWRDFLEDDMEMDRTLMYKQREQRKAFAKEDTGNAADNAELFRSLELKLSITPAKPKDLKRVAELINRTNQFNLEGSRTSLKEVTQWHQSPEHLVLTGQTSDRFGDMGTTCVVAVHHEGDDLRLLPFVLSCRVFGYSIEDSMMNHLKRFAAARGAKRVVGIYRPTAQNMPCKDFLPRNGFVEDGERWVYTVTGAEPADAEWLTVVADDVKDAATQHG